MKVSFIL